MQRLAQVHGFHELAVCGSVARGEDGPDSDIDLYLIPGLTTTASDWHRFRSDAEALVGCRVDIVVDVGQATPVVTSARADKAPLTTWWRSYSASSGPVNP